MRVNLRKYALSVYRSGQLIHADPQDYNLVYVNRQDGGEAVAQFKMAPTNAQYYGFGEKAGATLDKRRVPKQHFYGQYTGGSEKVGAAMTFFNYDNFGYTAPDLTPGGEVQGPLNPNSPCTNLRHSSSNTTRVLKERSLGLRTLTASWSTTLRRLS